MDDKNDNNVKQRYNEEGKKGFLPGNPGRPEGSKDKFSITKLKEAISKVEEEKKVSLYEKFVKKAYINPMIMVALIKKLIPDKSHAEIEAEFVDKTVDKTEQELERKFDERLEKDPDFKKRVIELYKETERILKEASSEE